MRTSLATARHELAEEKRSRQRDAGDFSHLLQRLRQWTETQVCSIEKRLPTTPSPLIQKKAPSSSSSEDVRAPTSTSVSEANEASAEANEAFDTKLQNLIKRLDEGRKNQLVGSIEAQMQKDFPPPVACQSSARTNGAEASTFPGAETQAPASETQASASEKEARHTRPCFRDASPCFRDASPS